MAGDRQEELRQAEQLRKLGEARSDVDAQRPPRAGGFFEADEIAATSAASADPGLHPPAAEASPAPGAPADRLSQRDALDFEARQELARGAYPQQFASKSGVTGMGTICTPSWPSAKNTVVFSAW